MLNSILNSNGGLTNWENLNGDKRPLYFEFEEIKRTLTDFVEMYSSKGQGMDGGWLAKIRRTIHHYNIYGRFEAKKSKGCSYLYDLLNMNAKNYGWVNCGLKLEVDFSETNLDWQYNEKGLIKETI